MVLNPQNLILRMPNWLGDAVMASPLIHDLRTRFPRAKLTLMCQGKIGELFLKDPEVDEIFTFHKPSGWLHRDTRRHLIHPLRHGNYDAGILTTNSFSSAWWFFIGGVKNRVGFEGRGRTLLLNDPVKRPKEWQKMHLVKLYKELLKPFGIEPSETPPRLFISKEEREEAKEMLKILKIPKEAKLVGVNPSSAFGPAKCWLPDRFHEAAKQLVEDPETHVIFFGDPSTTQLVDSICKELPSRCYNLAGKTTLREMMSLLALMNVFLTNDSGPMHIASALNIPLVALFGSTSQVQTGPYKGGTALQKPVPCSPCFQRVCPIDFPCMKLISVDEVVEAVKRYL